MEEVSWRRCQWTRWRSLGKAEKAGDQPAGKPADVPCSSSWPRAGPTGRRESSRAKSARAPAADPERENIKRRPRRPFWILGSRPLIAGGQSHKQHRF